MIKSEKLLINSELKNGAMRSAVRSDIKQFLIFRDEASSSRHWTK